MGIGEHMANEMRHEAIATRKVLERLPDDRFDWQPHDKSMKLGALASHLVNNFGWADMILSSSELDFGGMDFTPNEYHNAAECVAAFDKALEATANLLASTSDEALRDTWTLRDGERVYFTQPKIGVLRGFVLNHNIHHRAQLAMYLRLNDIPVPQIYGPSADEPDM